MSSISSYLTFNGNCREAMTFYRDCLGGELVLETIGDLPMSGKIPCEMKAIVIQATLTKGPLVIVGTDMGNEKEIAKGNAVAMLLDCDSEAEARSVYQKLSAGGEATHPLGESFWGALFGNLRDQFGNYWLIRFDLMESNYLL